MIRKKIFIIVLLIAKSIITTAIATSINQTSYEVMQTLDSNQTLPIVTYQTTSSSVYQANTITTNQTNTTMKEQVTTVNSLLFTSISCEDSIKQGVINPNYIACKQNFYKFLFI